MRPISFLFDGISFDARSIHVLCSRHNNRCKQSIPRFPLYMLWDLVLTSYTINSLPVCCSTNKLLKAWLGKAKFFAYVLTRKQSKNQRQKYRTTFFYYIEDHMQKFKPFRENFFFHPNRHLAWFCTHPFNKALCTHCRPMMREH